jgi:hypothetical protein
MINVENGYATVKGDKEEIFADISSISSYAFEYLAKTMPKEKAQEKIMLAVKRGFLITGEMDAETAYKIQELTKKINGGK